MGQRDTQRGVTLSHLFCPKTCITTNPRERILSVKAALPGATPAKIMARLAELGSNLKMRKDDRSMANELQFSSQAEAFQWACSGCSSAVQRLFSAPGLTFVVDGDPAALLPLVMNPGSCASRNAGSLGIVLPSQQSYAGPGEHRPGAVEAGTQSWSQPGA